MVSVIMPTFNRAHTLRRAVDSVLRQTLSDWELIVVDDGSTDDTPALLEEYQDGRIRMIRHPENRGVTAAKNTAFDAMRGEWFTVLDSDDELTPDALEVIMDCAGRTGADAITCDCVDPSSGALTGTGPTSDGWLSAADVTKLTGDHSGVTSSALLGELRFDPRLPGFEDLLWFKINAVAHRFYIHRALWIVHTEGSDRITSRLPQAGLRQKVRSFSIVGEDSDYLRALRDGDPGKYRRTMTRVWAARALAPILLAFETEAGSSAKPRD